MKIKKKYIGLLIVLPFFIFYLVFNLYPQVYTFILSLSKWDGTHDPQFSEYVDAEGQAISKDKYISTLKKYGKLVDENGNIITRTFFDGYENVITVIYNERKEIVSKLFDENKNLVIKTKVIGFSQYGRIYDELLSRFSGKTVEEMAGKGEFWLAFINTWKIWLPNIVMQLAIALFLGVIFTNTRLKIRGVGFFRAIFYFPNLVTAASIAILALVLLDWQHGALNQLLHGPAGNFPGGQYPQAFNWMIEPWRAQFIVSIIQTWIWFGFTMILLMAGMQGIPITYYEAADLDGASTFQTFFKITIPLLMPVFSYVVITSLIGGMQIFDIPFVFTRGTLQGTGLGGETSKSLTTMVLYMYQQAFLFSNPNFGYAAAVSYTLFLLIVIFSIINVRLMGRMQRGEM